MKVTLLGVGLMGQAISKRLLKKKQTLTVFNRSSEKTTVITAQGASTSQSAQQAIDASDYCLLLLSDAQAISAVLDTVEANHFAGKYFIQMGTIAPEESRELEKYIHQRRGFYLECPVLGSLPEARTGTLILMAAGEKMTYQACLPVLNLLGKNPQFFGASGQSATVKLAMNQLIAGLTSSFSLSLSLIEKEAVDVDQFMEVVRSSALYAPTFDKKLDRMLERDFSNPNFPSKHLSKDTKLFLDVAKQLGLNTSALEGIDQLLDKTMDLDLANTDYSAIHAAINSDN